jgi:hypothetical protein
MVELERGLLNPAALQLSVVHGPDRGAGERDGFAVGFGAEDAVVGARQHPSGRDAAAVLVLEGLDGVDVQVIDVVEELLDPVLDVVFASDFLAACLDDDVVGDEPVDGIGLVGVLDIVPEGVDNLR